MSNNKPIDLFNNSVELHLELFLLHQPLVIIIWQRRSNEFLFIFVYLKGSRFAQVECTLVNKNDGPS